MKRIKAACLLQTVHFLLKEDMPHDAAVNAVKGEVAQYKAHLERNRTKYRITEETTQPDGSIVLKVRKQYNQHSTGDYLD
ncbi:MAG TPA: hypothetical protein IAA32_00990 [Candidatus Butyricicoccus stercorigallinarum]|nr:hypothetical protein [Candidatus Butyricicoccus stercorigallinarum]